jgi:hypothetical protein
MVATQTIRRSLRSSRLLTTRLRGAALGLAVWAALLVLCGAHVGVARATTPIALGVNTDEITTHTGRSLDEVTTLLGVEPKIAMWYQDWEEQWSTPGLLGAHVIPAVRKRGMTPMVTWDPIQGKDPTAYTLSKIASGRYDTYVLGAAHEIATYKRPVFIRLAPEMNGSWSSWGAGVNGNTPQSYIAMWRHVVSIFRLAGATNASWVWSPNVPGTSSYAFQPYFPGDSWVNVVALDGYNMGTRLGYWQSFTKLFGRSYEELASLTNRPMMIAETSSAEYGGSKAAWIASIPPSISTTMPRIRAITWFDRLTKEGDWRMNSSPSALTAFRDVVGSGFFSGSLSPLLQKGP